MLKMKPSEMEIVQSLKQPLEFRRADQVDEYDPNDPTTYTLLVTGADGALIPTERPQTILPTGEVIREPDFQCIMLQPLADVAEGDIVIDEDSMVLFVDSVFHPKNTHVMVLGLVRQQ